MPALPSGEDPRNTSLAETLAYVLGWMAVIALAALLLVGLVRIL